MSKAVASTLALRRPKEVPETPKGPVDVDFGLLDKWAYHPGTGLTPRRLVSIFREAESGYPAQQADLYEDVVESDGHLRSQYDARVDSVAGKTWIVQAGGGSEEDRRAATILEAALRDIPDFHQTIEHQLSSQGHGYAGSEIIWERSKKFGGFFVPTWFANVPHRRFIFDDEDTPRLLTSAEPHRGIVLDPGKWFWSRRRGRQQVRSGLLRTCVWWALFKRLSVRDWIVFAERFGMPYVTGRYDETASDEDKAVLEAAVQALGKDGAATFSKACEIVITAAAGGGSDDVHGAIACRCDDEISKLLTGATLTSGTGGGQSSYALGRVHADVRFDLIVADAARLELEFQRCVGAPFVAYNGMAARSPSLKFHVVREADPKTRAEVMTTLANEVGLELDEEQVRQEFNLKAPTGKALKGTATQPPAPPRDPPA